MFQSVVIFLSSLFMCSAVYASAASSSSLSALSAALNERMMLMRDVAGYKKGHHLPVEDLPREKEVLIEAEKTAQAAGLAPDSVGPFVRALMNASKAVQYRYLADWLSAPGSRHTPADLSTVRERILKLDNQIMTVISQRLMAGHFSAEELAWLAEQMRTPHLTEADKHNLFTALSYIQRSV